MDKFYFLGADPGKHGAVVLTNESVPSDVILIPAKVTNDKLDVVALWDSLYPYRNNIRLAAIEDVHALFGSSATGTFNFGEALGSLTAVIHLLSHLSDTKFKIITIQPKLWQKEAWKGISKQYEGPVINKTTGEPKVLKSGAIQMKLDTKATSLEASKHLYPEACFIPKRCRVVHDGCVDAALIAYYARLYYTTNGDINRQRVSSRARRKVSTPKASGSPLKLR